MIKVHSKISFKLEKKFIKNQIFVIFDPFLTWITEEVKTIFVQGNVAVCYYRSQVISLSGYIGPEYKVDNNRLERVQVIKF